MDTKVKIVADEVETYTELMLPDLSVLSTPEVEIPTLTMDSDQLNGISLSGIINQFINVPQEPDTQASSEANNIVYHITPLNDMMQQYSNTNFIVQEQPTQPQKPYIRIIEQPKSNSLRFRYQCEGRGAGALQGQYSTQDRKTYPKIQIVGTNRKACVVVSCVTHDTDIPRAHPHNLVSPASVGKDGCKKGVCTLHVNNEDMTVEFQHLGIQCVRKKDIEESLKQRKDIRVDPYSQGFKHVENASSIDLNAVKLCFQAFIEDPNHPGKFSQRLDPVCSTNIFDAKARKELQIMDISDSTAPAEGGKKILIFCEKVAREDIKVKFSDNNGWEGWGDFTPSDVHKQYGIALKTPKYKDGNIKQEVKIFLTLYKQSDDSESEPTDFRFLPRGSHESTPYPVITSGHNIKNNFVNNFENDLKIKQEGAEQSWAQARMSGGYTTTQFANQQPDTTLLNIQPATTTYNPASTTYNQASNGFNPSAQSDYIPNIPNVHNGQVFSNMSPNQMSQMMSPYNCQQPSPDSQSFANMNLASPQQKQENQYVADEDIENISGKIESFSLSGVLETSLDYMQGMEGMQPPVQEPRRGKRGPKDAALESGSNVVPREMPRLGSEQLNTPNCSDQINSSNMNGFLRNCSQINDL